MQSCLYFESSDRTAALAALRRLRTQPKLSALSNLRIIDCLTVASAYSAETLAPLLGGLGGSITHALPLTEDTRCVTMQSATAADAAALLHAAGIDATVVRQPIVLLYGLDDEQYRDARDMLSTKQQSAAVNVRSLPEDAFIGFTRTPIELLYAQAKQCGLALPEECLARIAEHYRALNRDPWPDELLLLDEAFRQANNDPAVCAPVEFLTDDARLHAAYADLMAKRRALFPDADAPATLGELSSLATRYLCGYTGKPLPLSRTAEVLPALAASGGICCGGAADLADESVLYLTESPLPTAPLSVGDRILLVLPGSADEGDRFPHALTRFFADSAAARQVRRSISVEPGRLVGALGRMLGASRFGLQLSAPPQNSSMMAHLTPLLPGALMACKPDAGKIIPDALRAQGLRFMMIAAVQKSPTITLGALGERINFPAAMLAPRPALCAEVPAPDTRKPLPAVDPLSALLASLSSPALRRSLLIDSVTAPTVAQFPTSTITCGNTRLCTASIEPADDPYGDVRDCALSLVARLVAAGAPLSSITLSLHAEMPTLDRRSTGRSIAALLGLHTVQIETGLLAEPATLHSGNKLRVTIGAYAPMPITQSMPLQAYTPIWLLAPRSTEPHLNGERALLGLAAAERAAGRGSLIAPGMLAPSAAAAQAALDTGLSLTFTAPADVLNTPIPCGMLLAAPAIPPLPEGIAAIELGIMHAWNGVAVRCGESSLSADQLLTALRGDLPAPTLPFYTNHMPPRISAHRSVTPRVILPYADQAPHALAATVRTLGGEPILCRIDLSSAASARQSISAYADLLDTAQILLLSGSRAFVCTLLCHRRAVDALAKLRARDGLVCTWGPAFAAMLGYGYFSPNGASIATAPLIGERVLCSTFVSANSPWVDGIPLGSRETIVLDADPLCPTLSLDTRQALAASGCIVACAAGTPDGTPAVTALVSADGSLLGRAAPPSPGILGRGIAYFA